jgi:hypothetical protein
VHLLRHHQPCAAIPATRPPSRTLPHHPQCCGSTGRQDAATSAAVRPPAFRQPDPRNDAHMTTREEAPTPPPSKPLLDGYRAHHDALPEARFTRTTVYSTTLCTILLHVARTVRRDCKLPPLAYKRRGQSPGQSGDDGELAYTLTVFTTILALRPNQTSGTWRPCLFSHLACSSPLQALRCSAIQCLRAHHCWTYGLGQNQDKPRVT